MLGSDSMLNTDSKIFSMDCTGDHRSADDSYTAVSAMPRTVRVIASGMNAYLSGIPGPLYALFATGYLGYTVAREWGKAKAR